MKLIDELAVPGRSRALARAWPTLVMAFAPVLSAQIPTGPPHVPLPHPELPKPPAFQESTPLWLVVLLAGLGALLIGALIWLLMRRKTAQAEESAPPLTLAHRRLLELLQECSSLSPSEVGHRVSVIVRDYQESRYHVPAPCRTREELYERGAFAGPADKREKFAPLALRSDQIAFAATCATRSEAEALVKAAIEALRHEAYYEAA